jgi:hypothetical protein
MGAKAAAEANAAATTAVRSMVDAKALGKSRKEYQVRGTKQ